MAVPQINLVRAYVNSGRIRRAWILLLNFPPCYSLSVSTLDDIMQALPVLSPADKLLLRETLDRELCALRAKRAESPNPLLGLMADMPEVMDEIVEEAYALRALPLRLPSNGQVPS